MTPTNRSTQPRPVGVLYEHPDWFEPLFAELERRDLPYSPIDAASLTWDPADSSPDFSIVLNRMSPSAWLRGQGSAVQSTAHFLAYLDTTTVPVINGSEAYAFEISKARQLGLLNELGFTHPKARVINNPAQAVNAAAALRYPVLVKPNVGGSGAGIISFETSDQLATAAEAGELEFGPDHTALVQEHLEAQGDSIVRVEFLGGEFLYAIRLRLTPGTFNLCPADYCDIVEAVDTAVGFMPIEAYKPSPTIISDAGRLLDATGAQLGGVEYLVDAETGEATFYDINALSNFVADAETVIGFDPVIDLVDFIEHRIAGS